MTECFARSVSRILRKFTCFRFFTRKYGNGDGRALAEKEEENQKSVSLFRYRDSSEEIQGKC
jgi:hypothetical protein